MIQSIQFAGHSALFLTANDLQVAIDPWLEGNPSCPENLKNPTKLDLIALTHGHSDHASDVVRLHKATGAQVLATYELAMILIQEGIAKDAVIPMNKGGTFETKGISFTLTNAFHSNSYDSPTRGTLYAGEACGLVVRDSKFSMFHAGDTALFSDLELIANEYEPTVAFLPIGDRFTMGGVEAAQAARFLGVKTAIPIHYKTFPSLAQTADTFVSSCHKIDIDVAELNPGDEFKVESVRQ